MGHTKDKATAKLRPQTLIILAGLGIQLILGMITNLFVKIPDVHPGAKSSEYFSGVVQVIGWSVVSGFPSLALHVILGLSLIVASAILLVRALQLRHKKWIIVSSFGLLGIISASFNGSSFIIYGEDLSSLAMEFGFIMSCTAYIFGLLIEA